jgi:hypothetical protein
MYSFHHNEDRGQWLGALYGALFDPALYFASLCLHVWASNCFCRESVASLTLRREDVGGWNCCPQAAQAATHGVEPMCFTIRTARLGVAVTTLSLNHPITRNGTLLVSAPPGVVGGVRASSSTSLTNRPPRPNIAVLPSHQ